MSEKLILVPMIPVPGVVFVTLGLVLIDATGLTPIESPPIGEIVLVFIIPDEGFTPGRALTPL